MSDQYNSSLTTKSLWEMFNVITYDIFKLEYWWKFKSHLPKYNQISYWIVKFLQIVPINDFILRLYMCFELFQEFYLLNKILKHIKVIRFLNCHWWNSGNFWVFFFFNCSFFLSMWLDLSDLFNCQTQSPYYIIFVEVVYYQRKSTRSIKIKLDFCKNCRFKGNCRIHRLLVNLVYFSFFHDATSLLKVHNSWINCKFKKNLSKSISS